MRILYILIIISCISKAYSHSPEPLNTLFTRFQKEVDKKVLLNKDTLVHLASETIWEANRLNRQDYQVKVYLGLASGYIDKNEVDSSLLYGQKAFSTSLCLNDTSLLIQSHLVYGWTLIYNHSDYEGAISEFRSAEQLSRSSHDSNQLKASLSKLVMIYYLKEDLLSSYDVCQELVGLCKELNDITELVNSQYMLGSLYGRLNLYDRQMETARYLLSIDAKMLDATSLYKINYTAREAHLNQKEYSKALIYARNNLVLAKAAKKYPTCFGYVADVFFSMNQLDSAKYYYEKMLTLQYTNNAYIDTYEFLHLAKIELQQGNRKKAYKYLAFAERDITKPSISIQKNIYKTLYEYYLAEGNEKKAFHYLQLCEQASDNFIMYNNSIVSGIAVLDKEEDRLQAQISLLLKDKELKDLSLAKSKQAQGVLYSGLGLIVLMFFYGFARYKKQKNRKAKEELNQERLRISRELHDEVGSTLSGISMYSHLVSQQVTNQHLTEAQQSLTTIQQSAKSMMVKLNEIIWLIHPEQDSIESLFQRIRDYANQMTQAKNMTLEFEKPTNLSKTSMSMETRRHVFLFCKESINNAVKYSGGSSLKIRVISLGNQIKISVTDNGVGFDEITVRKGNGLKNMEHRAATIGGQFRIESSPNQGSTVNLLYNIIQ